MESILTLGIDDAGRGPVIGPMVLAGCLVDEKTEREFKKSGVKDSKLLTAKRREFLAEMIREKAEAFEVEVIHPGEIDGQNHSGIKLNEVEALACAKIINRINKGYKKLKVIVDCPSVNISKWTNYLKTKIKDLSNLEISCKHKADRDYVPVSAASILAKSVREKEMSILKGKFGEEIGSGYCSDQLTCSFLEKHFKKHADSGIFRQTWATWQRLCAVKEQKNLAEF